MGQGFVIAERSQAVISIALSGEKSPAVRLTSMQMHNLGKRLLVRKLNENPANYGRAVDKDDRNKRFPQTCDRHCGVRGRPETQ